MHTETTSKLLNIDLCKVSIAIACVATVALKRWSFVVYATQIVMILMVLWNCTHKGGIPNIRRYFGLNSFFALWCSLSVLWSTNPSRALSAISGVIQFVVLGCCVAMYALCEHDYDYLVKCLAWSGIMLLVVLFASTPLPLWSAALASTNNVTSASNRIGGTVGYHANALGHICAVCSIICYYIYRQRKGGVLYLAASIALATVILFTKSRLSVVMLAMCLVLYSLFSSNDLMKQFRTLLIVMAVLVSTFWSLLNVDWLYQLIGFRFVAMLGLSGRVDASTRTRAAMIQIALDLFRRHPFTGVGFDNYAVYYLNTYGGWAETYAHSNYAELLADLGIIGAVTYYAVPYWTLITLFKHSARTDARYLPLFLTLSLCLLVSDYSSISYTNDYIQIIWALVYSYASELLNHEIIGEQSTAINNEKKLYIKYSNTHI